MLTLSFSPTRFTWQVLTGALPGSPRSDPAVPPTTHPPFLSPTHPLICYPLLSLHLPHPQGALHTTRKIETSLHLLKILISLVELASTRRPLHVFFKILFPYSRFQKSIRPSSRIFRHTSSEFGNFRFHSTSH